MALTDKQRGRLLYLVIARQRANPASDGWRSTVESSADDLKGFELDPEKLEELMDELREGNLTTLESLLGMRPARRRPGGSCFG